MKPKIAKAHAKPVSAACAKPGSAELPLRPVSEAEASRSQAAPAQGEAEASRSQAALAQCEAEASRSQERSASTHAKPGSAELPLRPVCEAEASRSQGCSASVEVPFRGWHSRGYLPHRDEFHLVQSVTFRLADSLPEERLVQLQAELALQPESEREAFRRARIDEWIDSGLGCCALRHPAMAETVQNALLHHDGDRYRLIAWCIMPNHVHVLILPFANLFEIVRSWKGFTGRWAAKTHAALGFRIPSQGFWMKDYWDRFIRDERHFGNVVDYIQQNPVKAGLCAKAAEWPWSSVRFHEHAKPGSAELPLRPMSEAEASRSQGCPASTDAKPGSAELPLRPESEAEASRSQAAPAQGEAEASRSQGSSASTRTAFCIKERIGADSPRTLCHFDVSSHGLLPEDVKSARVDSLEVPVQASSRRGTVGVFLSLPHFGNTAIEFSTEERSGVSEKIKEPRWSLAAEGLILQTASGGLCLPSIGETMFDPPVDSFAVPAPIRHFVTKDGRCIGRGYIDTYERVTSMSCEIVDDGPLWTTVRIQYVFDNQALFSFECTAAEGEAFVRIAERSTCGPKSRWIVMFDEASGMLPDGIDLADHTLFHQTRRLEYFSDRLHARLYPWTQATQIAALREGVGVHASKSGDAVGWFVRAEQDWDGFKNTFVEFHERRLDSANLRTRGGETAGDTFSWLPPELQKTPPTFIPAFCAEAMLMEGSREYAVLVGRRRDWHAPDPVPAHVLEWYEGPALTNEWESARSPLRRMIQFQGLLSLDIVKDWSLSGKIAESGVLNPAHPAMENACGKEVAPLLADIQSNAAVLARKIRDTLQVLSAGYVMGRGPGGTNPVTLRAAFPLGVLFREMVAKAVLPERLEDETDETPPLSERITAMLLFLAHLLDRRSSYPGEFTMAPMGDPRSSEPTCLGMPNQNFFTDVYCAAGGVAMLFPGHPCASDWLARANRMLAMQLDTFSDPDSGVWEESHTYFHHVLRTLAPFALEQRGLPPSSPLAPVRVDWFRDVRFIRLCRAVFHFVTPRDPNANGKRMMATLGDHRMELDWHTFNALAIGFAETEPTLAAHLAWMSIENGWVGEPAVPPLPPKLVSHDVPGLGAVLRGRADAACGGESMVVLRAGHTWGHHNCDELETLYYSGGEPVIVEAGYGNPKTFPKVGPGGHSLMHPVDFEPAFYLSRANRGRIDVVETDLPAGLQVLAASRPVAFMHPSAGVLVPLPVRTYRQSRRVEWFENAGDGTSLLTIIDEHDGDDRQQISFHTGGLGVERVAAGVYRIVGHARDSLLKVNPAIELEILPDACGFTHGLHGVLPEGTRRVVTTIVTAPKSAHPSVDQDTVGH